ncbi:substrate-binding periplasmic protein [Aestuariispira insulae]|uniref:Amino acid ABC transporter substrate-binding protein (PAAT family) n=1 Tax=Aestuariispira insulae TaxID=1461337 RepID=A0A3D9HGN5_9PROT|nr:transporter substrate-binding domain-containing protein [Aestuariispira insulae]RED48649.1 amino acid ABC transporter substrate-binding protein (PAAT family) [Aestuariispira insulae]
MIAIICLFFHESHACAEEDLSVGFDPWPPFAMVKDGQYRGIAVDIIRELAARNGYRLKMRHFPVKRLIAMFEHGDIDVIPLDSPLWNDENNQAVSVFSNSLFDLREFVYLRAGIREGAMQVAEMQGLKLAHVNGYAYPALASAFQRGDLFRARVSQPLQLFKMARLGRVDGLLLDEFLFSHFVKEEGVVREDFQRGMQLSKAPMAVKLHKSKARLLADINRTLMEMKAEGRIDAIFGRYADGGRIALLR